MSTELVRANPVVDELVTDEGSVVLVSTPSGHRVVRLSLLGQLIREVAVSAIPLDRLASELESWIGSPPGGDGLGLVRRAVADLERDGLVTVRENEAEPVETA